MTIKIIQGKKKKRRFVVWVTINHDMQLFIVNGQKQLKEVIHQFI